MLGAFNAQRQELFSQFGSNFVGAGARGVSQLAGIAGVRNFGAVPGEDHSIVGNSGGNTNHITNNFAAPPPDPHTWTKQQALEVKTM